MSLVLVVDKNGTPKDWCVTRFAACYYARNKVAWEVGQTVRTFKGGLNKDGEQSTINVSSIIGVTGPILGDKFYSRETVYAERYTLYARDRNMCGYCGNVFHLAELTIDHVHPRSRGGKNTWVNCVSSCKRCNHHKGNRTPEEAHMPLLYVPYAPTVHERILLKNRKILGCQMEFLMSSIPKTSRVWTN